MGPDLIGILQIQNQGYRWHYHHYTHGHILYLAVFIKKGHGDCQDIRPDIGFLLLAQGGLHLEHIGEGGEVPAVAFVIDELPEGLAVPGIGPLFRGFVFQADAGEMFLIV